MSQYWGVAGIPHQGKSRFRKPIMLTCDSAAIPAAAEIVHTFPNKQSKKEFLGKVNRLPGAMDSGASSAPSPPSDPEVRNIIDKLAQFVARNGPAFENMTKTKQARTK